MKRRRRGSGTKSWIMASADRVARHLTIPATAAGKQILIMMVGLPGTGKSYVASRLAERLPAVVVRTDEIRKVLFPRPTYLNWESGVVYQTAHELIRRYLKGNHNVIFDGTNLTRSGRKQVRRIADEQHSRFAVVVTEAREEVVMERLLRRVAGRVDDCRSDADWNIYLKLKGRSQPVTEDHWTIDTSGDIDAALERFVKFVEEGDA